MKLNYDKDKLTKVCDKNQITYLGLFGSYARDEADENSDVDLIVEFAEKPSLLKHVGIEFEISEELFNNRKVDLITKDSINKYIRPYVTKDLKTLYEKR